MTDAVESLEWRFTVEKFSKLRVVSDVIKQNEFLEVIKRNYP